MADDKGGGGGWEWTALEIILILLLAIALIDRIQGGNHLFQFADTSETGTVQKKPEVISNLDQMCGLIVTSPRPLEKVSRTIVLNGSTEGCDWYATPTTALYAQVVDSKGKPVSQYTLVAPQSYMDQYAVFATSIPLTAPPASGIGYLILIPAVTNAGATPTARIPIQLTK